MLKQIGAELDGLKKSASKKLFAALKKIAEYATTLSIKDLEILKTGATEVENWHFDYKKKYVGGVHTDTFNHIAAQIIRRAA